MNHRIERLLDDAVDEADRATKKFGPHPSVEFAACRVAEESGELIQAATSVTRGPDFDREADMRKEAVQAIAMIIRLMYEFPKGCDA